MKCAICGNENPASASFCAKCGVALSPVYAADVVAPPSPGAGSGNVANEPGSASAAPAGSTPAASLLQAGAASAAETGAPKSAESPRRAGLIVALVALLIVLGVAGYFGWRTLLPGEAKQELAGIEVPKSAPATPTPSQPLEAVKATPTPPQAAPAQSTASAQQPPSAAAAIEAPQPAQDGAKATAGASAPERGSPKAASARAEAMTDASKAPSTRTRAAQTATRSTSATAPTSSRPTPAETKMVAAAGTGAVLAGDRWQQMTESITGCAREDILTRVVCEQRVRLRFCNGYWGQVPQCPSAQNKEHGQ